MNLKSFGFVVALKEEAKPLLDKLKIFSEKQVGKRTVVLGSFSNHKVSLIISGCGKIKTACATQFLIDKYPSDFCFNFGTAGAISPDLKIGEIIIATKIIEHDVKEKFPKITSPPIHIINEEFIKKFKALKINLKFGPILSGDEDIVTTQRKKALFKKYRGLSTDWESAGFALTCEINNVPFLVFRTISDLAYEQTTEEYEKNQKTVIASLVEVITKNLTLIG